MTNKLLNVTVLEKERIPFYLNIINQRLNRLKEIKIVSKGKNISNFMSSLRPPIFWKDKPNFIKQEKLWDNKKLSLALNQTYNLELNIKSNSDVNKTVLIKKLLLDLCVLANS